MDIFTVFLNVGGGFAPVTLDTQEAALEGRKGWVLRFFSCVTFKTLSK